MKETCGVIRTLADESELGSRDEEAVVEEEPFRDSWADEGVEEGGAGGEVMG